MAKQAPARLAPLMDLVPAPERPLRRAEVKNWNKLTKEVEFDFPNEFLDYGRVYGTGGIDSAGYTLLIANPLDPKYAKWLQETSNSMRTRGATVENRKTRYYPEVNGIVPIGSNLSGDFVFYSRKGTVVSYPAGDPNDLVEYPFTLIEFLVTLFSGRLKPEYFPNKHIKQHSPVFAKRAWLK